MHLFKFSYGPYHTNAILVACSQTKKAVIIDPSFGCADAVLAKAQALSVQIEKILLTHSHWDHFADAKKLKTILDIPLYVHPLDEKNLLSPGSDGIPFFIPLEAVSAEGYMEDADVVEVGNLRFSVIHTPGHSPGSICLYSESKKTLISGDTLFQSSMGNVSFPSSEPEKMWDSLAKLAKLPPDTKVVPGHGPDTQIGRETWLSHAKEMFS